MNRELLWDMLFALGASTALVIVPAFGPVGYMTMSDALSGDLQEICPAADPSTVMKITTNALHRVDRGSDLVTLIALGALAGFAWLRVAVGAVADDPGLAPFGEGPA